MAVITITITESPVQIVSGIPRTISIDTSIPATVFYTLDEEDPTLSSDIAVGYITMPTNQQTVVLKLYATNGTDESAIITQSFGPNTLQNVRRPHAKVSGLNNNPVPNTSPFSFGTSSPSPDVTYGNIGGVTVDSLDVDGIPDGWDGTATGTPAVTPDLEYNRTNYDIKYSTKTTTSSGPGVGNLPATVTIVVPPPVKNFSDANSSLFDPKALVIIQDGREETENVPMINRQFFSMADNEKIRDGSMFLTTGFEGSVSTGSLLRPQYNSKDNTWTFPYRDAETNRWIFSIEPASKAPNATSVKQLVIPSSVGGSSKVFKWIPFKRSHLR